MPLTLRRETKGRAGKTVTRVLGIPAEDVDDILHRIKRALGCGAVVEGGDLVLLGDLEKRAGEWFRSLDEQEGAPQEALDERGGTERSRIRRGLRVAIVQKADQSSGALTEGVVRDILTNSSTHPHGIKVRLESGEVGRVKRLLG